MVLLANGIGPVLRDRNRKRVKEAVEGADVVTLRDEDSLKTLREMGVKRSDITVTADPVFLLPPPDEERTDELLARAGVKGDFIAVSVRPLEEGDFRVSVARVCDELNKRFGVTTVFVPFQPTRDIPVSRAVAEQMKTPSTILPAGCTARELMGVMTRSVLVLSMRLHAVIFAACAGTPTVGFSYDPKVAACLRMLDQPSAGSAEHIDEAGAVESASRILSDRKTAVSNLRKRREQISALAEKNREIFQKLV